MLKASFLTAASIASLLASGHVVASAPDSALSPEQKLEVLAKTLRAQLSGTAVMAPSEPHEKSTVTKIDQVRAVASLIRVTPVEPPIDVAVTPNASEAKPKIEVAMATPSIPAPPDAALIEATSADADIVAGRHWIASTEMAGPGFDEGFVAVISLSKSVPDGKSQVRKAGKVAVGMNPDRSSPYPYVITSAPFKTEDEALTFLTQQKFKTKGISGLPKVMAASQVREPRVLVSFRETDK